jgi:hypothetical protein
MHVLTDARPLPQRGPIVEQDPHARGIVPRLETAPFESPNSLPVNRLTRFLPLC